MNRRPWHHPAYDPLWAEIERLGVPLAFHGGGQTYLTPDFGARGARQADAVAHLQPAARHPVRARRASAAAACSSGSRTCKVALLEGNCSWAPWFLYRLDEHWEWTGWYEAPELTMPPSEYFKRNCWISVEADEETVAALRRQVRRRATSSSPPTTPTATRSTRTRSTRSTSCRCPTRPRRGSSAPTGPTSTTSRSSRRSDPTLVIDHPDDLTAEWLTARPARHERRSPGPFGHGRADRQRRDRRVLSSPRSTVMVAPPTPSSPRSPPVTTRARAPRGATGTAPRSASTSSSPIRGRHPHAPAVLARRHRRRRGPASPCSSKTFAPRGEPGVQAAGCSLEQADDAVRNLAGLHAATLGRRLAARPCVPPNRRERTPAPRSSADLASSATDAFVERYQTRANDATDVATLHAAAAHDGTLAPERDL